MSLKVSTRSSFRFNWQPPVDELKPRLRRQLAIVIAGALFVVFALSATYIIVGVLRARSGEIGRLIAASADLSQALDREVARSHALLMGLEYSPALQRRDLEAFQKQMAATRVPEGSWLILSDREKLVVHSLRPFGSRLPTLADFTPQPAFLERIDQLDVSLTGRVGSLLLNQTAVTVNMKARDPDGGWTYFLTTVLSDQRFASIVKEQQMAPGLTGAIYDHSLNGVVSVRGDEIIVAPVMAEAASFVLGDTAASAESGLIRATDQHDGPSLIAYTRSGYTQWIATTSMTRADLDAPLHDALKLLAGAGFLMGLAGIGVWRYLRREIESPIERLERNIAAADANVEHLTERLLHVQEDEHQRIARELHDSTAQHLVGAMLGVANLERIEAGNDGARSMLKDVKTSVESALNELRTFTFLIHPRDLGEHGLARALRDFAQGFIHRSGLTGTVSVDSAADFLPFELQRSLLRIAQGALANVHRHAKATQVDVRLEMDATRIVLSIEDNGLGSRQSTPDGQGHGNGVGIPSMHGRLIPFGGELKIEKSASGTVVRAVVPRPAAS
ncbi:histidine kinase [Variovorax sp. M-6]|uniref:histidine kinase n=1 Tax=Variovorax sp. M-6 TaxID=3233041 RepID=UPI003F96F75E